MLGFNQLVVTIALVVFVVSNSAAAVKPTKLAQIFNQDMFGADLAYLEHVTGPARSTYGDEKEYKVDGCKITATVADGSVRSLELKVSPKCTFNINPLMPSTSFPNKSGKPTTVYNMTFGQFDALYGNGGRFKAGCWNSGDCGNYADPSVYEYLFGSHSNQGIGVLLTTNSYEDGNYHSGVLAGAAKWIDDVAGKAEGDDWVKQGQFNCTTKYNAVAHRALRNVTISAIKIGFDIQDSDHQYDCQK